jgi:hypothetical protein
LIASGVQLAEVSMLLGHSELRVTMDFYGHLQQQTAAKAAGQMDAILGRVVSNTLQLRQFWQGFGLTIGTAAVFNVLSVYHAWFRVRRLRRVGRVPFAFISHGAFFTETTIWCTGIRDNAIAIATVAVSGGFVATRFFAVAGSVRL